MATNRVGFPEVARGGPRLAPAIAFIVTFFTLLISTDSNADVRLDQCRLFFAGHPDIPRPVRVVMDQRHDVVANGCLYDQRLTQYASVTPARIGLQNVCTYQMYKFQSFDNRGRATTTDGFANYVATYMAMAGQNCPTQDDPPVHFGSRRF